MGLFTFKAKTLISRTCIAMDGEDEVHHSSCSVKPPEKPHTSHTEKPGRTSHTEKPGHTSHTEKPGHTGDKIWISLFTCCVTHALHLELVPDMTTDAFLRCFRRFASPRGTPAKVISDNSRTFKAANKEQEYRLILL